jgi:hypothetical protein
VSKVKRYESGFGMVRVSTETVYCMTELPERDSKWTLERVQTNAIAERYEKRLDFSKMRISIVGDHFV